MAAVARVAYVRMEAPAARPESVRDVCRTVVERLVAMMVAGAYVESVARA